MFKGCGHDCAAEQVLFRQTYKLMIACLLALTRDKDDTK